MNFTGRVVKVYGFGKNLVFFTLTSQGSILDFVYEKPKFQVNFGDFLLIEAISQYNEKKKELEYKVIEILKIIKFDADNVSNFFKDKFTINNYEKLSLRMSVEAQAHTFFKEKDYTLLSSPSLVGDWVKGGTGSFELDFYKKDKAYLTISTMLHSYVAMSLGYDRVYEIATLFRKENPSSDKRLAEFTNIVVNQMNVSIGEIMVVFEDLLYFIHKTILNKNYKTLLIPPVINFEKISFQNLLSSAKISAIQGHQMGQDVRDYLDKNFSSFVWITNFPEHTRPFYCKGSGGVCNDSQLWYRGKNFIAAGSEVEMDVSILKTKLKKEGKLENAYLPFLETIASGVFSLSGMDLGVERFLGVFVGGKSADYTLFPVYENNIVF